ncbi:MAG TPA: serine/threonine-protein kinase [Vicinamibacteria bacterium]
MICPSCGAANDAAAEVCFTCRAVLSALTQGSIVGDRYEILSPLGRGGMGAVYRAHDRVLDETVALKVLRGDVASAPEMAKRFRSEIKLARRVAHPNVCRIYEYGEDGPRQYISMELVEGTNLKEVLKRRGPLPAAEACGLAAQVADGLAAIHRVGIVHRDLKTLNVMIDAQGAAKVMDFGIAKKVEADGTPAPSGSYVVGSPEYMSPEQARGQPVDFRSDIYALGIIVFELFTGRVPFRGDTPVATLLMHIETPPPLDGPGAAAIPSSVRPVLRKALAKDPADRYAGAQEMADALRAARDDTLGPRSAPRAPISTDRRRSRIALAAIALVTIAVLGLLYRGGVGLRATPEETAAPVAVPTTTTTLPAIPASSPLASPAPEAVSTPPGPSARRSPLATPAAGASPSPTAVSTPTATTATIPPSPAAAAAPATPSPSPSREADGWLLVLVKPWADVSVDGKPAIQTPFSRLALPPGPHSVVLSNPEYQDYRRKVTIRPGELFTLDVNLATDGVRRAQ